MQPFLSLFDVYLVEDRGIAPLDPTERHLLSTFEVFLRQEEGRDDGPTDDDLRKKEESDPRERVAAFCAALPSLDRSLLPYERVLLVDYARFRSTVRSQP